MTKIIGSVYNINIYELHRKTSENFLHEQDQ